jgi:hypothetical protein
MKQKATLRHDSRSVAREASAAPAASFKRSYRNVGLPTGIREFESRNHHLENAITTTMDTKRIQKAPANLIPNVPGILTRPL